MVGSTWQMSHELGMIKQWYSLTLSVSGRKPPFKRFFRVALRYLLFWYQPNPIRYCFRQSNQQFTSADKKFAPNLQTSSDTREREREWERVAFSLLVKMGRFCLRFWVIGNIYVCSPTVFRITFVSVRLFESHTHIQPSKYLGPFIANEILVHILVSIVVVYWSNQRKRVHERREENTDNWVESHLKVHEASFSSGWTKESS